MEQKRKFTIVFWIFQNGKFAEEQLVVHELNIWQLTAAITKFSVEQSGVRLNPQVRQLIDGPRKFEIQLPKPKAGLGPQTYFVIKKVITGPVVK